MEKSKQYEGYRAYDVEIEGISIILNYRSTFSEQAGNIGITGVIKKLHEKNKEWSK